MDTRLESGWQRVCRLAGPHGPHTPQHVLHRRIVHEVPAHQAEAADRNAHPERSQWDAVLAGALCQLVSDPDSDIMGVHLVTASPRAVAAVQAAAAQAGLDAEAPCGPAGPGGPGERRPRTVIVRRERLTRAGRATV